PSHRLAPQAVAPLLGLGVGGVFRLRAAARPLPPGAALRVPVRRRAAQPDRSRGLPRQRGRDPVMLDTADLIAFAATTDLDRARTFYEQVLGLLVTEQTDLACVFDANGTMLRVTAVL